MKLWNELTEEEQKAVIDLAVQFAKIIEVVVIDPLVKLFGELTWFFMACEGILQEEKLLLKK